MVSFAMVLFRAESSPFETSSRFNMETDIPARIASSSCERCKSALAVRSCSAFILPTERSGQQPDLTGCRPRLPMNERAPSSP